MRDTIDVNHIPFDPPPAYAPRHVASMLVARRAAEQSRDPSTQVGCALVALVPADVSGGALLVLATGYNRFPEGVTYTPERLTSRPDKYMYTVHAEANALHNLLRNTMMGGPLVPMADVSAYIWGMSPCTECLKDLVDAGVRTVFYHVGPSTREAQARYAITAASQTIINETGARVVDCSTMVLPDHLAHTLVEGSVVT